MVYDKIIIGAGLYGLYSALYCARKKEKVLVIEKDSEPFMRATYINQARVHMGYHYPRSLSTAKKSADYFKRFTEEFKFCIHSSFDQIYATSANFSWTNKKQFLKFCADANIRCEELVPEKYFRHNMCDAAFMTEEYTYDAHILRDYYLEQLSKYDNVEIRYNCNISKISEKNSHYEIQLQDEQEILSSDYVLNVTYASVNQIIDMLGYDLFKIKYELCEIILCNTNEKLKNIGLTVMDGPFFSIMPFGKTGLHSLTSVTFTPHVTSYDKLPTFKCQNDNEEYCNSFKLGNCNACKNKPHTAWSYMSNLARKYMIDEYEFDYQSSLFSMKPILVASEVDDSRPTVIREFNKNPRFISVLSGKINTVYDLDEVL